VTTARLEKADTRTQDAGRFGLAELSYAVACGLPVRVNYDKSQHWSKGDS